MMFGGPTMFAPIPVFGMPFRAGGCRARAFAPAPARLVLRVPAVVPGISNPVGEAPRPCMDG
jgi:hypothetical protein